MSSRPKFSLVGIIALLIAIAAVFVAVRLISSGACIHKCTPADKAYSLDAADRKRAVEKPDATTKAIVAAGYVPVQHVTGSKPGDDWTLRYAACGDARDKAACAQAAGTVTKPRLERATDTTVVGDPKFTDPVALTVVLGKTRCFASTQVTAAALKALPGQVAALASRQDKYAVPATGKQYFTCYAG